MGVFSHHAYVRRTGLTAAELVYMVTMECKPLSFVCVVSPVIVGHGVKVSYTCSEFLDVGGQYCT